MQHAAGGREHMNSFSILHSPLTTLRPAATWLADREIWFVAGAIAASVLSERLLPVALVVAAAFWVLRWLAYGRISQRTPADWAIVLLLLTLPLTLWATAWPTTTWPQVYRLLTGIALYYAVVNWTTTLPRLRLLLLGSILTGVVLAIAAPVTVNWFVGKLPFIPAALYDRFVLLVADRIHPNVMAGHLLLLIPYALAVTVAGPAFPRRHRLAAGLALLVIIGVLLLTQSRGGLLAFLIMLLTLLILRWRWGWVLPLAAIAGVALAQLLGLLNLHAQMQNTDLAIVAQERLEIWSRALAMLRDFPLTGIGMGTFGQVLDLLYPLFLFPPGKVPHAHNLFLQVALDLGLVGLAAWVAILLLVTRAAWHVYRAGRSQCDTWLTSLGTGLLCSQVALIAHGLTDAVTWGMVRPAVLVWALWGLTVASWRLSANRTP